MVLFASLLAAASAAQDKGVAVDQCHRCHATLSREGVVGEHLAEYEVSPHGRAHIGCARCHGGESSEKDKEKAHEGVRRPSDPLSRVHGKRQPATCGECHSKVLASFEGSKHARALQDKGVGPTCTTCHTSMGSGILGVEEVAETCKSCHKPGGVARDKGQAVYAARLLVEVVSTQRAIALADALVRFCEARDLKVPGSERLVKAKSLFGGAPEAWHTFDPARTRESIAEAVRLVDRMRIDLEALEAGKSLRKKSREEARSAP